MRKQSYLAQKKELARQANEESMRRTTQIASMKANMLNSRINNAELQKKMEVAQRKLNEKINLEIMAHIDQTGLQLKKKKRDIINKVANLFRMYKPVRCTRHDGALVPKKGEISSKRNSVANIGEQVTSQTTPSGLFSVYRDLPGDLTKRYDNVNTYDPNEILVKNLTDDELEIIRSDP